MKSFINRNTNNIRLSVMLIVILIAMTLLKPQFYPTKANFVSMGMQLPEYGLIALGCALAMMVGGIDLSLVGIANLVAIVVGSALKNFVAVEAATGSVILMMVICTVFGIITGALCGAVNGFLIGYFKIPAILATLGSMQLYTGIGMVITRGKVVTQFPDIFSEYGTYIIAGFLPVPFILFALCSIVVWFIAERSTFGIKIRLLGTSARASQLTGYNNTSILIRTHLLGGILAAFSGMIMLARMNSARADFGTSYTMQAILMAVLGGVNPNGGFGSISGVIIAGFILQSFASGLNMFGALNAYFKEFAWGVTLLLAFIINYLGNKQKGIKALRERSKDYGSNT